MNVTEVVKETKKVGWIFMERNQISGTLPFCRNQRTLVCTSPYSTHFDFGLATASTRKVSVCAIPVFAEIIEGMLVFDTWNLSTDNIGEPFASATDSATRQMREESEGM